MRRIGMILGVLLLLALPATALAARAHFVGAPQCVDNGTTVTCSGKVAGLGNEPVTIDVAAVGTATVTCTNPGGNVAPGQTKQVSVGGTQTLTPDKNGNVVFSVTTDQPQAPADACPNDKWTAAVTDVTFQSAKITVTQGSTVLTREFTF